MVTRKYNGVHFHFNYNTQKLNIIIYSLVTPQAGTGLGTGDKECWPGLEAGKLQLLRRVLPIPCFCNKFILAEANKFTNGL